MTIILIRLQLLMPVFNFSNKSADICILKFILGFYARITYGNSVRKSVCQIVTCWYCTQTNEDGIKRSSL